MAFLFGSYSCCPITRAQRTDRIPLKNILHEVIFHWLAAASKRMLLPSGLGIPVMQCLVAFEEFPALVEFEVDFIGEVNIYVFMPVIDVRDFLVWVMLFYIVDYV